MFNYLRTDTFLAQQISPYIYYVSDIALHAGQVACVFWVGDFGQS